MQKVYNTFSRKELVDELYNLIYNFQKLRVSSTKFSREYGDAIEALRDGYKIVSSITKDEKITVSNSKLRVNAGSAWTLQEEYILLEKFHYGNSFEEIGKSLGRSSDAIELRLAKLNKIKLRKELTKIYYTK